MKKNGKGMWQWGYDSYGFRTGRVLLAAVTAVGVLGFGGCGSSGMSMDSSKASEVAAPAQAGGNGYASDDVYGAEYAEETAEEEAGAEPDAGFVAVNRKLIKTVRMDVETEEFEVLVAKLEQKVKALGGYIEDMNVYNGSRQSGKGIRHASMTARIPKEQLDGFVGEVGECSNVVNKSESTEDVTLSYVDLESHKKALQVEQDRLMELLEKAVTMEDIITIEERLSQVRYELENMESRLRTYDNLVDFSTVYLSIEEVEILTPVKELSDWEKMGNGFAQSVKNLVNGVKGFLIGLVICLPYLIFMALLVLAAVLVIKAVLKKSRKKEAERLAYTYGTSNGAGGQMPAEKEKIFSEKIFPERIFPETAAGKNLRQEARQQDTKHPAAGQPDREHPATGQQGTGHTAVGQQQVPVQSGTGHAAGQTGIGEAGHFSGQDAGSSSSGQPETRQDAESSSSVQPPEAGK